MNPSKLFSAIPILSALALLATPSIGRCDRDTHGKSRTFELSRDHHHHHGGVFLYRPYPYYGYPYYYGPSFGVTIHRSYAPSDSGDLAADVQQQLRRRGYYHGPIDGDVGPGTRNAIRNYQDDRGLPVTGRIDRYLLRSLGIG
jgi:hypothetical protein